MNYDENPELNITPLVDIMLVLLAILMVAMPAIIYEEKITVPDGTQSKQQKQDKKDLIVRVELSRKVHIDQDTFELPNDWKNGSLADKFVMLNNKYKPDTKVYIKADEGLKYGDVTYVLKSLSLAGYKNTALQTK